MIFQVGDYNTVPTGLPMIVIRDHAQLVDGWVASHPSHVEIDSSFVVTDPVESIERFGVTADSPLNTWSAGKWLDEHAKQFLGKRLDYVLFRQPEQREGPLRHPLLKCVQSKVVFTDKAPRREFSYSDHFGLEATFHIESTPSDVDASLFPTTQLADADIGTVVHALTTCYQIPILFRRGCRIPASHHHRFGMAASFICQSCCCAGRRSDDLVRDDDAVHWLRLRKMGGQRITEHY
jgi:sphingomyelin phosphodiesterase 2